jgi:hypothetical protein
MESPDIASDYPCPCPYRAHHLECVQLVWRVVVKAMQGPGGEDDNITRPHRVVHTVTESIALTWE